MDVYGNNDPNRAWFALKCILTHSIDKVAPFTTKRIKGKPCPWLTNELKNEMNFRDQLLRKARRTKRQLDWDNFKRKRNYVTNLIRSSKNKHHQNLLKECENRPAEFWKTIKQLFPTKQQKTSDSFSLNIDGNPVSKKSVIAEEFCKYFHKIPRILKEKFDPLKD